MAGKKQFPNGTWQYVIKRAGLLEKPMYVTFANQAEGDAYVQRVEALLDKGIVPADAKVSGRVMSIRDLVREYEIGAHVSPKDKACLSPIVKTVGGLGLSNINADWVDNWIAQMKREEKLAPASIRARVGALARCTDWGMRKGHLKLPDHALRNLPEGYANYTKADEAFAGVKRVDVERDRRLEPGEFERILDVINCGVLPRKHGKSIPIPHVPAVRCLFILAVETAMRMREMATLTVNQVNLYQRTIFLEKTKNGDKRQVPLSSVAVSAIKEYLEARTIPAEHPQTMLFPWWDGEQSDKSLHLVSDYLSKLFSNTRAGGIVQAAGISDLGFHDLRHEATSRFYEKTDLTDLQIAKITGHKSMKMLSRYANLRGSTLADALW